MSKRVPDFVNPFRAAESGQTIAGRVEFARMGRLVEAVENRDGGAEVRLSFAIDEQGVPYVWGQVSSEVVLICQRCLEPMTVPITIEMALGIVDSDDEAKCLPERYEPLVTGGKPLMVAELIEDEILLALPAIPRHNDGVCAAVNTASREESSDEGDASSANPFAVLARLKSKH